MLSLFRTVRAKRKRRQQKRCMCAFDLFHVRFQRRRKFSVCFGNVCARERVSTARRGRRRGSAAAEELKPFRHPSGGSPLSSANTSIGASRTHARPAEEEEADVYAASGVKREKEKKLVGRLRRGAAAVCSATSNILKRQTSDLSISDP